VLRGVDSSFYVERRRPFDEILPWDHIDCGIKKSYLRDEYEKSMEGVFTPDCRSAPCNGCGICVAGSGLQLASATGETGDSGSGHTAARPGADGADCGRQPEAAGIRRKLRLRFAKLGDGRFLSHLELVTLFSRAVKRAGISVRFSEGFHPLPRIIFGPALPVGIESEYEYVDMEVADGRGPEEIMSALNRTLPEWVRVRAAQEIPLKCSALSDSIAAVSFKIRAGEGTDWFCNRAAVLQEMIDRFQKDETRPVAVRTKRGLADIDLKQWVESIALNGAALELTVKMSGSKTVRPSEILKEVLDLSEDELRQARVKKTGVRFRRSG
jgi:radical SAM-linked protein